MPRTQLRMTGVAVLCALLAASCTGKAPGAENDASRPRFVVGLGEIMGLNQMRHAKLWFAGQAGNWPLAAYEIDELREGFGDVERYHPHHKDVPEPIGQLVQEYVGGPLADLDKAVADKDHAEFNAAFDALTNGCNGCHEAAHFGFNVIRRPTSPPYSNQSFEPAKASGD